MRLHPIAASSFALMILLGFSVLNAQDKDTVPPAEKQNALEELLAERDSDKALDAAIEAARKCGVSEQAILEARFLYHVDRREDARIAAMLPEFLKRRDEFKLKDSAIFALEEDWLAVVEYVQAMDALEKNDKTSFKKHITEAFWLSPRQAAAFAPQVERIRLEEFMRTVKVDFTTSLQSVKQADTVALDALISGKKALLLHFWSPLSPECEAAMPDFAATAAELEAHGVAVASLIPENSPKQLNAARAMIDSLEGKSCGRWLVDSLEKPLGRELRVQNLPTMVLVSPQGAVLFNGDPTDDEFWKSLNTIDAAITRPKSSLEKTK